MKKRMVILIAVVLLLAACVHKPATPQEKAIFVTIGDFARWGHTIKDSEKYEEFEKIIRMHILDMIHLDVLVNCLEDSKHKCLIENPIKLVLR